MSSLAHSHTTTSPPYRDKLDPLGWCATLLPIVRGHFACMLALDLDRHTADAIRPFLRLVALFVSCLIFRTVDCRLASGSVASLGNNLDIVVLLQHLPIVLVVASASVLLATVSCTPHQSRHRIFYRMLVLQCASDGQIVLSRSAIVL